MSSLTIKGLSKTYFDAYAAAHVTAVAVLYAHFQGLPQVQSIFFGVGPATAPFIAGLPLHRGTDRPVLSAAA